MVILTLLRILILTPLILRTNALYLNKPDQSARIVGGSETTIEKAKYVVNLRFGSKFFCGGSLVAPKVVITAAHCASGFLPWDVSVIGGATYLSEEGTERSVSEIHIPIEYDYLTSDMDIAILILSEPMEGANISTIELCKTQWKAGDQMTIYGWGRVFENFGGNSDQLRSVNVPIVEQKACGHMYSDIRKITNSMFCAGDLKGKDACNGDSGGPAVFKNQLCGVVSWGFGCGRYNYPGVYANIMFAREFIVETMKKY